MLALRREGEQVASRTFDNTLIIFYNKNPEKKIFSKNEEKKFNSNFFNMFSRYIIRHIVGILLIHFRLCWAYSFAICDPLVDS